MDRIASTTLGSATASYTYDGAGTRMLASSGSTASKKTDYDWDPNGVLPQPVAERDGNADLSRRYRSGLDTVTPPPPTPRTIREEALIDPLDLAVVVVGFIFALWSTPFRTARLYTFLIALAIGFVGADLLLAEPGRFIVKAGAIGVYVLVLLYFRYLLLGLSRSDSEIDRRLNKISVDVNDALSKWERGESTAGSATAESARRLTATVCEEALVTLEELRPPSDDWQRTVTLMRRYLGAVQDAATKSNVKGPPPSRVSSTEGFEALRDEISLSWAKALKRA